MTFSKISQFIFFFTDEGGEEQQQRELDESPEHKDALSSGSASPSSTHSLESAPIISTMIRDREPKSPRSPPPHLIDSHDDVEHRIPATLIQDTSVER